MATRGRRLRARAARQAAKGRKSEVCGGRAASRGREDRRFVRAAQRVPHPKDGNCAEWQRDNGANDGTATWAVPPHPPRSSPGKSSDAHQHARYPRADGAPPRVLRHRRMVGRVQLERAPRRRLPRHSEGARPIPVEDDNSLVPSPAGGGETHSCVAAGATALRSGRLGGAGLLRRGGGRRPAAGGRSGRDAHGPSLRLTGGGVSSTAGLTVAMPSSWPSARSPAPCSCSPPTCPVGGLVGQRRDHGRDHRLGRRRARAGSVFGRGRTAVVDRLRRDRRPASPVAGAALG